MSEEASNDEYMAKAMAEKCGKYLAKGATLEQFFHDEFLINQEQYGMSSAELDRIVELEQEIDRLKTIIDSQRKELDWREAEDRKARKRRIKKEATTEVGREVEYLRTRVAELQKLEDAISSVYRVERY